MCHLTRSPRVDGLGDYRFSEEFEGVSACPELQKDELPGRSSTVDLDSAEADL